MKMLIEALIYNIVILRNRIVCEFIEIYLSEILIVVVKNDRLREILLMLIVS